MSVNWTCEGLKHDNNNDDTVVYCVCELNLWGIETPKFQAETHQLI